MNHQPKLNVLGGVVTLGGDVVPAAHTLTGNKTMQTPYQNIGEATRNAAFITGADGHDKASILRRTIHSYEDPAQVKVLDDDGWQRLLYLIDAAPKLLEALRKAKNWIDGDASMDMDDHDHAIYNETMEAINAAIDLATKDKP